MGKRFLFVDSTDVDRTTRKSIRRHVMNGKNAGKTHHRSSRLDLIRRTPYNNNRTTFQRSASTSNEEEAEADQELSCPVTNYRNLGNPFLSLSFPLELTPRSLKVINEREHAKIQLKISRVAVNVEPRFSLRDRQAVPLPARCFN
jgi:hypothetical protein